jgi:hypothetical protein
MATILAIQMAALLLAVLSIGLADLLRHRARITRRLHAMWVAASIAAMCLPILGWTANIFVGPGAPTYGIVGILEAALFFSLYRSLCALSPAPRGGHGLPPSPVEQTDPPAAGR